MQEIWNSPNPNYHTPEEGKVDASDQNAIKLEINSNITNKTRKSHVTGIKKKKKANKSQGKEVIIIKTRMYLDSSDENIIWKNKCVTTFVTTLVESIQV